MREFMVIIVDVLTPAKIDQTMEQIETQKLNNCIVCAAVKIPSGAVFLGARHAHCFAVMRWQGTHTSTTKCEQGFITASNRFITRSKAFQIVLETKQYKDGFDPDRADKDLYSEDLR